MSVVAYCFIRFLAAPLSPKYSLEENVEKKSITQAFVWEALWWNRLERLGFIEEDLGVVGHVEH